MWSEIMSLVSPVPWSQSEANLLIEILSDYSTIPDQLAISCPTATKPAKLAIVRVLDLH